jgi:amino-acid N-acetyltransferase
LTSRQASTPGIEKAAAAERKEAEALIARCDLPLDGLDQTELWCVKGRDGHLLGVAGLETWGTQALLRSVAVEEGSRSSGIGRQLVAYTLKTAESRGSREVYLLTETAPLFFQKLGFRKLARSRVKGAVLDSVEFRDACPESAQVMRIRV